MRIIRIEKGRLLGHRPRAVGANARLGPHGGEVRPPVVRITTDTGMSGFGWSWLEEEQAQDIVGFPMSDAFDQGVTAEYREIEYPVLDLAGNVHGKSVSALLGESRVEWVACYDTSLYFDDLHLSDHTEAADLIAGEAMEGFARGHRNFKIKVGRGAMHMPVLEGTKRDIAVINAVHSAVSAASQSDIRIMIDANNGYNLNLAKMVLDETAGAHLYWLEEAFHEDPKLYEELKNWMAQKGIDTLIADGEGDAGSRLLEFAKNGLIDVIQYDIHRPGFSFWCEQGPLLDSWGVRSAPHHFGGYLGNFTTPHLSGIIRNLDQVEWDEATVPGIDAGDYKIEDGRVCIPDTPGFGLRLDDEIFAQAVESNGFIVNSD